MAIEMNRKILTRISALLCAVILVIPNISNGINANAEDMDSYGAVYADDGHKIVNLDIAGNHYPDAYKYMMDNNINYTGPEYPATDIHRGLDKTYTDYYKKNAQLCYDHPCMQYVVCRVHELTGKWISNTNINEWGGYSDFNSSEKIRPYSIMIIEYKGNDPGHAEIVEDVDTKNKRCLCSTNYGLLETGNSEGKPGKYVKSITYIYFGNAVAQKRIKDHIKECGDHIIYTTIKEPTCNAPGAKIATCSKCGWVCDPAIEIKHTGHRYIKSYIGKKEPIDIADHKAKYVCEDCGHTLHYNSFTIDEMKRISRRSHYKDKKADEIRMGRNITSIGADAFNGCANVRTIEITSTKLKSVGKNAFKNTGKNAFFKGRYFHKLTVYVPAKRYKKYKNMFIKAGLDKRSDFVKQYYDEGEDMDPDSHTDKTEVINDGTEDDGVVVQVKQ